MRSITSPSLLVGEKFLLLELRLLFNPPLAEDLGDIGVTLFLYYSSPNVSSVPGIVFNDFYIKPMSFLSLFVPSVSIDFC